MEPVIELDLYIIRHGQSIGNVGYGREELTLKETHDPILTDVGVAQAQAAGEFYKGIDFDAFYASPLLRASRTAAEIINKQSENKVLNILPELCEVGIDPEYKGVEIDEIRQFYENSEYAEDTDVEETRLRYDKHETPDKVYARAKFVVDYLRSRYTNGEKVAIVSHAAFITNLVFYIMELNKINPAFDIDYDNTGLTRITYYKPGTYKWGDTVFRCINDTSHFSLIK